MSREQVVADLQESGKRIVEHALAPDEVLDRSYGAGKWSIREMLAHLADVEMINAWRFLRAAAEPGCGVEVFDENVWAERLEYARRPGKISGDLFAAARGIVVHHVATLSDERLEGASMHPEKGPMTGWQWAHLIHGHGAHHLTQLDAARDGTPWSRPAGDDDSWKYLGLSGPESR